MSDDAKAARAHYLDPEERIGEILFGSIMVLSFTLTARLTAGDEPYSPREMLIATIGCNVAWGIIDGGMYIMSNMMHRTQRTRAIRLVQEAKSEAEAMDGVKALLNADMVDLATDAERHGVYEVVHAMAKRAQLKPTRVTKDDFMGGIACFLFVTVSLVPAALPFLFMNDADRALRVSNFLLVALLFVMGYRWASLVGARRWLTGLTFMTLGLVLVAVAIALGG